MYRRLFIAASLLLSPIYLFSGTVTLSGSAPGYAGTALTICQYADFITYSEEILATDTVTSDGRFSLTFRINNTALVFMHLGKYYAYLYAEPDHRYQIELPAKADKTEADRLNPYFTEEEAHLLPFPADSLELNHLIARFDEFYGPVLNQLAMTINAGQNQQQIKPDMDSIIHRLIKPFNGIQNSYFMVYERYKTGSLLNIGYQFKSKGISEAYFKNQPVLYDNPAYMELFHKIYDRYFGFFGRTDTGSRIFSDVNSLKSYRILSKTLASDGILPGDSLRELVILKNLHDECYSDHFSRSAIVQILDSTSQQSRITYIAATAARIRQKVTRLMPGYAPPDFRLTDQQGKQVSLKDFKGLYVYLNFCFCASYSCMKDFEMLRNLEGRHFEHFTIVTVVADPTWEKMKKFVDQNDYHWTFLHYGNQPGILKDFDIRIFPTYFLIGPDGKLIYSPAPSPGENIELYLFRAMRARGDA